MERESFDTKKEEHGGERIGKNKNEGAQLESNQVNRHYRHDHRSCGMAVVSGISENMVGAFTACNRKTDGTDYVVFHCGRIPLYPGCEEVYQ